MITIEKPNNVVSSGIKNAVSFGIKQEGLAHIFSVLRNQLYSDKILAVIREYSCNAVDAHTEAGKSNLPIQITLPSRFNAVFKVRDFGQGLSDEGIQEIYAFYGESTKRKSNQMIGQLGLGSKSAFAYGDNFVIASYVNGTKTTYNAFIDPSQIGKIAKLASESTTEENGVEISVAVRDQDIQAFAEKSKALFRYFKVKPIINGDAIKYEEKNPLIFGADWKLFGAGHASVAVMGNIGYPFDNHFKNPSLYKMIESGIEVQFEIGDLEISASREKLQYTDHTKKAIEDKLNRIINEVSKELDEKFNSCNTYFDACKFYGSIMDYSGPYYGLKDLFKGKLHFKGTAISDKSIYYAAPLDGGYNLRLFEITWRSKKIRAIQSSKILCNEDTILIDNDLSLKAGLINRVYDLVNSGKSVYLISYNSPANRAKILNEMHLEDSNLVKISSLPKLSWANSGVTSYVKNTKHSSKEFVFDMAFAAKTGWHRKNSDFWTQEEVDVENDAGVYVIINQFNFQSKNKSLEGPNHLYKIINSLGVMGIVVPKVYGFKLKHVDTLTKNPNMEEFFVHISRRLTEHFASNNTAQKVSNRIEYQKERDSRSWIYFLEGNGKNISSKTVCASVLNKINHLRCKGQEKVLEEAAGWKEYFSPVKPEFNMESLIKQFDDKYPLVNLLNFGWRFDDNQWAKDALVNYINLIDG